MIDGRTGSALVLLVASITAGQSAQAQDPPDARVERPAPAAGESPPETQSGSLVVVPPDEAHRAPRLRAFPRAAILVDPLTTVLYGQLDIHGELEVSPHWSVYLKSTWVLTETPPSYQFSATPTDVRVASAGLGPLSTWTVGGSYWLGDAFASVGFGLQYESGYYAITSEDAFGILDATRYDVHQLTGSLRVFESIGHFVLGAGLGLGFELSPKERCPPDIDCTGSSGNLLLTNRDGQLFDVNGPLSPFVIDATFLLGVQF